MKIFNHFYNYVTEMTDAKTYKFKQFTKKKQPKKSKHIWIVNFNNKALKFIQLLKER